VIKSARGTSMRSALFDLLADQMDINVHPRLTHFPLIVKIKEEDDRQFYCEGLQIAVTAVTIVTNAPLASNDGLDANLSKCDEQSC
jgi:hypothetical protein